MSSGMDMRNFTGEPASPDPMSTEPKRGTCDHTGEPKGGRVKMTKVEHMMLWLVCALQIVQTTWIAVIMFKVGRLK